MSEGFVKSGAHLGAARSWIQRKFWHGDRVTWGSDDPLGQVTVRDIEYLSQEVSNAMTNDISPIIGQLVEMIYKHDVNHEDHFRILGLLQILEFRGIKVDRDGKIKSRNH